MTNLSAEAWFQSPRLARVFDLLNRDGGEVRVVGGAVRNSLMGLDVEDIDLATTLSPQDVTRRAGADGIKAVPTGIDHGTVTLVIEGQPFEVTTLRRDVETDGRHAEVAFGVDWAEDAARRDLTINALYAGADGEVIDLVDGLSDIETGTVRFIGDAARRIDEDYLRVLRFFRFFAWYGKGRPDADGLRASARAKAKLSTLSAERVWAETKKLLSAPDPGRALLWMRQSGVLSAVLPETEKWGIDAIPGLVRAEQALHWTPDPLLRLAAIVPRDAERLAAMAERLRLSKVEATCLDRFAKAPSVDADTKQAALDRMIYRNHKQGIVYRLKLELASAREALTRGQGAMETVARYATLLSRAEAFEAPQMPVAGGDLLAAGIPAGPELGQKLKTLEEEWVNSNFALDRDKLLERLKGG
ncbi:CCA tRNA nucleotidyltransferase [Rhizobium halophytocola]|uniref:Poly(A) polymerase n=1 Tax=Rhizobium halophytocola TaxID=735519 RepID=A0ABS4E3P4_9HYPH|nr:CCA tRNA nucleotidyltransferase [Rhizobium halophytocola]MBP1852571.1 poly(A) polymerase [Rhizobium halophytocola]